MTSPGGPVKWPGTVSRPRCNECGEAAFAEVYSRELRRWRWWCRPCLAAYRGAPPDLFSGR